MLPDLARTWPADNSQCGRLGAAPRHALGPCARGSVSCAVLCYRANKRKGTTWHLGPTPWVPGSLGCVRPSIMDLSHVVCRWSTPLSVIVSVAFRRSQKQRVQRGLFSNGNSSSLQCDARQPARLLGVAWGRACLPACLPGRPAARPTTAAAIDPAGKGRSFPTTPRHARCNTPAAAPEANHAMHHVVIGRHRPSAPPPPLSI